MASSDGNRSESPLHLPEPTSPQGTAPQSLTPISSPSAYGAPVPINPLPPGLAAPPDMMSLLKALKRHWLLATTLGLIAATAASVAAWYFMPVKYIAESTFKITMAKLVQTDNEGASPFSHQTIASLVKDRHIIGKALAEPNVANLPIVREQLDPVQWLRGAIQVTYLSPELMTVSLAGYNPAELVTIVDAVARVYSRELGTMEQAIRKDRVAKLDNIITKLQGSVNREKKEFQALVENIGAANAGQRQNQADFDRMRLRSLTEIKLQTRNDLDKLQAELERTKDRKKEVSVRPSEIARELKEHKDVKAAEEEIAKMKDVLAARERVMVDKTNKATAQKLQEWQSDIKAKEMKLEALKARLVPEIKKELTKTKTLLGEENADDLTNDIAAKQTFIKMLDDQIAELGKEIKKEGPESLELEDKRARYTAVERVIDSLRVKVTQWGAEAEEASTTAKVPDGHGAVAFAEQNLKKQIMIAGGSGGAAMALVLFIIAYWEFTIRRINTAEDVVYGLGWRLVGQLPPLPERSRGGLLRRQVDPSYWQNLMTESVDATRTTILHAARVEGLRTVMVTSAVSGEGKTSLSCHLACSLARAGRKTLLLDCDLRNPAAHRLFELPAEPGLCEVLRGEIPLADVIRATPAANLWLVPAGQFDEQALQTFTLSDDGFSPLLEQLKTQFDFIVIDSSPVLPVVDALVIGQHVDVVVFSLLRDVSRIPSVYAAYQRLATLGIRILGAVVNGVDTGTYGYSSQYAKQSV